MGGEPPTGSSTPYCLFAELLAVAVKKQRRLHVYIALRASRALSSTVYRKAQSVRKVTKEISANITYFSASFLKAPI